MSRLLVVLFGALASGLLIPPSVASESTANRKAVEQVCEGEVCFQKEMLVGESKLPLRGIAKYRYWGFRLYTAALYGNPTMEFSRIEEAPYALVLHYHRGFSKEDFIESSNKIMKEFSWVEFETLKNEFSSFYQRFKPVKEDDRYAMVSATGQGFDLLKNGTLVSRLANPLAAKAYIGIWLHPEGIDKDNSVKLLKRTSRWLASP